MTTDVLEETGPASDAAAGQRRLIVRVRRSKTIETGRRVWTGLLDGYPRDASGRTVRELFDEVEAVKHVVTGADSAIDVAVDYRYEIAGFPAELLAGYQRCRAARDQAAGDLRRASDKLAATERAAASALKAAGLTVRDGATLMGLSKSKFDHLS